MVGGGAGAGAASWSLIGRWKQGRQAVVRFIHIDAGRFGRVCLPCPQHGRAGARLTRTGREMASVMSRGVFWGPGLGTPPRASNRAGSAAGASGVVLVVGDDETARAGGSVLCPRGVGTFGRACLQLPLPCVRGCGRSVDGAPAAACLPTRPPARHIHAQ